MNDDFQPIGLITVTLKIDPGIAGIASGFIQFYRLDCSQSNLKFRGSVKL